MKIKINNDIKYIVRRIIIIVAFLAVISLIIFIPMTKSFIPDNSNSKYKDISNSKLLKEQYDKEGNKEKFLQDALKIQQKVSMILLNGDITNEEQQNSKILELNNQINDNNWKQVLDKSPEFWVGYWNISNEGKLKFKFIHKAAEPTWVSDEDVQAYIELN